MIEARRHRRARSAGARSSTACRSRRGGRELRHRRRIGLGQIDAAARPRRARCRLAAARSTLDGAPHRRAIAARARPRWCRWCSRTLRLAPSAPDRRRARWPSRCSSTASAHPAARIAAALAAVGLERAHPLPLSAPALRRPAPARRDRARADARAAPAAARRADLGARRAGAGGADRRCCAACGASAAWPISW